MRHRLNNRGMTLIEVVITAGVLALLGTGLLTMLMQSLRSWSSGTSDEAANSAATTALQRLAYDIREGRSATSVGSQLTVTFPKTITDPITGEKAYDPILNDPVTRSYYVSNGNLVRNTAGSITILGRGISDATTFSAASDYVDVTIASDQKFGTTTHTQKAVGHIAMRNFH